MERSKANTPIAQQECMQSSVESVAARLPLREVSKEELYRNFCMMWDWRNTGIVHPFRTHFLDEEFGETSMNVIPSIHTVSDNEFYPFGRPELSGYRSDLLGLGLGVLAHTLVVQQIVWKLMEPQDWTISERVATGKHAHNIQRMGNGVAKEDGMPILQYLKNARDACRAIGFPID
jgi:hypothetical protein